MRCRRTFMTTTGRTKLHAQIGRRALRREGISADNARQRATEIHNRTWAALGVYRDLAHQRRWWPAFVLGVLGHESAVADRAELGPINIFSE